MSFKQRTGDIKVNAGLLFGKTFELVCSEKPVLPGHDDETLMSLKFQIFSTDKPPKMIITLKKS